MPRPIACWAKHWTAKVKSRKRKKSCARLQRSLAVRSEALVAAITPGKNNWSAASLMHGAIDTIAKLFSRQSVLFRPALRARLSPAAPLRTALFRHSLARLDAGVTVLESPAGRRILRP